MNNGDYNQPCVATRTVFIGTELEQPVLNPDAFRKAMRSLAAGVNVICTQHAGERTGLTATAVCSVSADPPSLLVCVNRNGDAHDKISKSGILSVNVLTSEQEHLAKRFAGADGAKGEAKFTTARWVTLKTGAPILKDALAAFDCRVIERVNAGSHTVFICQVVCAPSTVHRYALGFINGSFFKIDTKHLPPPVHWDEAPEEAW
ncbi:flavin reductase family protein [Burkholderia multivorans]|uniref:Flavin reductase family protein n=1 Tax=Burkholderia multivorans TaxID=87883 RepID=A0AAP2HS10_9BURK|nr:flavin reductase family protein [Burkholderia multivorans]MBU9360746.1 flavin reductase family protein [Burkholderia multivorans]MBU9366679.1 flavin reductase family protein [Burkholderia multivorans]MBU9598347.1 flavin reductase family protein [Burkholderia multivorans]MCA8485867.1 flavin reductase family protein [Burkholderia multivorans]